MSWQLLQSDVRVHKAKNIKPEDMYAFEYNKSEGHVKVHYRIFPRGGGSYRVQFETLEVIDDKEAGSGDWRIKAKVDSMLCHNSPEEHWSVGTDSSVDLGSFRTINKTPNDNITVYCKVEEEDS